MVEIWSLKKWREQVKRRAVFVMSVRHAGRDARQHGATRLGQPAEPKIFSSSLSFLFLSGGSGGCPPGDYGGELFQKNGRNPIERAQNENFQFGCRGSSVVVAVVGQGSDKSQKNSVNCCLFVYPFVDSSWTLPPSELPCMETLGFVTVFLGVESVHFCKRLPYISHMFQL